MSPSAVSTSKDSSKIHPLAPLTADEISLASSLLEETWPSGTKFQYKAVTLQEPPKKDVLPYLEAERNGQTSLPQIDRKAFVIYYLRNTNKLHEAVVNLTSQTVDSNLRLGDDVHGAADGAELMEMEQIALNDPTVQQEIAKLKLPEGAVVVIDPWPYGSDGLSDEARMFQCFMYMRAVESSKEADSNHYALPLPISPVISAEHKKVIRVDICPTGKDNNIKEITPKKVPAGNEYLPEKQKLRTDLKPLQVIQPEGASFKIHEEQSSHVVEWQKWSFRVGFNQREGMVLYNVWYDNRQLFYRLSLSDMNIPYADPRHPYHKKSAFDLGDAGAGLMANNLQLGCDCLGSIYYLSATLSDDCGKPQAMPNVVCIHEQDGGISWKHTNYRTGRAVVARNRELVLQTILTVANYEYVLSWNFNQAAELHYEVRATGILSTQPIDEGIDVPWGTVVHPGVLATYHQHMFSLRIDPAIDGHLNRLVYTEAHAMPKDSKLNPHGNGYVGQETIVRESGGLDTNVDTNRTFKIANATVARNPINGAMPAYKLHLPPYQKILSNQDSFNYKRAEFADQAVYALAYHEDELYSGGKYTNQSRGGQGVRSWASRKEDIVDKDIVVFAQFGINHIPRIEDFPVMPSEIIKVSLKPVNFFDKNPALDVPPSVQSFNQSTLVSEGHRQGTAEAKVNGNGHMNGATNGAPCH